MLFCNVKKGLLKEKALFKCRDIDCYEFLYDKGIYPISEINCDEEGFYFEYLKCVELDTLLNIYNTTEKGGE